MSRISTKAQNGNAAWAKIQIHLYDDDGRSFAAKLYEASEIQKDVLFDLGRSSKRIREICDDALYGLLHQALDELYQLHSQAISVLAAIDAVEILIHINELERKYR